MENKIEYVDKKTITCTCYDPRHYVQIVSDREDNEIVLNIGLNTHLSFWNRIVVAFKYIFKRGGNDCYDTIILQEKELNELKDFIKEHDKVVSDIKK